MLKKSPCIIYNVVITEWNIEPDIMHAQNGA